VAAIESIGRPATTVAGANAIPKANGAANAIRTRTREMKMLDRITERWIAVIRKDGVLDRYVKAVWKSVMAFIP
jgi:hypothetical protein